MTHLYRISVQHIAGDSFFADEIERKRYVAESFVSDRNFYPGGCLFSSGRVVRSAHSRIALRNATSESSRERDRLLSVDVSIKSLI